MKGMLNTEVLIVGAGPVGMACANLLGQMGRECLVIDKEQSIFDKPRAIALDNEALRVLQSVGIGEGELAITGISKVVFKSPIFGDIAEAKTAGVIDCHPKLVTFFQPDLEQQLHQKIQQYPSISVRRGMEFIGYTQNEKNIVTELLDTEGNEQHVTCQFIIAADGANSRIRELIGASFGKGKDYKESWLVVDVKDVSKTKGAKPIDHLEFICDPKRTIPHMPAPGDRERWEFKLRDGEDADFLMEDQQIHELLLPWFPNRNANIERKAVYRFRANTASRFSKHNVFLVGDAAHVTPPFVGQGLVAGLRDAFNLCWKIDLACRDSRFTSLLASYDTERRPHAKSMIDLAVLSGRIIMPQNKLSAFLIHGLVSLTRYIPGLKNQISELEIKPANRFKQGLFDHQHSTGGSAVGGSLNQSMLVDAYGSQCLSDQLAPNRFKVIFSCVRPEAFLTARAEQQCGDLQAEIIQIGHCSQRLQMNTRFAYWEDILGALVPNAIHTGWVAIIRPDNVIFSIAPAEQVGEMISRWHQLMSQKKDEVDSIKRAV